MIDTDLLSWVIGAGNPLSALLTGPLLARLARSGRVPASWVRPAQGAGWVVLGIAQAAFLVFGVVSGLPGFRFAQPFMIVVAGLNFAVWWSLRPRPPAPPDVVVVSESGVLHVPGRLLRQREHDSA